MHVRSPLNLNAGPTLEKLLNDNHSLSGLKLAFNQLGDAGALGIARSLPYTHWMTALDLRSNGIGEQVWTEGGVG
jgi:hypothetical protein